MVSSVKKLASTLLLICFYNLSFSQNFIPGNTYFDSTGYVEYRAGNLPIIIGAPHGGSVEPSSIPDRSCNGCVTVKDSWTKTIAEGMYDSIVAETGCYPHLIINLLHRKKFDANRGIVDAADGNPIVEQAWYAYHGFIDSAKSQVVIEYSRGLFLDIHGHGKPLQRIELGYTLSGSELRLPDSVLNDSSFIKESSIRRLSGDNIQNHSHSDLLRGQDSYGTLMSNKGFAAVPSLAIPFPLSNEPYFSGGYSTQRHGSRDSLDEIDAIQLELNRDIRFSDSIRPILVQSLSETVIEYYDLHYNNQFEGNYCDVLLTTSTSSFYAPSISIYPNPATSSFRLETDWGLLDIIIYNLSGKRVLAREVYFHDKIDISHLENGLYMVQIWQKDSLLQSLKLSVQ